MTLVHNKFLRICYYSTKVIINATENGTAFDKFIVSLMTPALALGCRLANIQGCGCFTQVSKTKKFKKVLLCKLDEKALKEWMLWMQTVIIKVRVFTFYFKHF